jgi:RND family efflux transporter MFP subunit
LVKQFLRYALGRSLSFTDNADIDRIVKQVKQDDLLARLDPADYQAALNQAQAQYDLSKSQFDRVAELVERQLVSRAEYDQRLALMKVRQSDLTRARNNLDYSSMYAPFDGIIARILSENHESVAAGQVVMVLQTGEMIDITVAIPESIIAHVERREVNRDPRPVQVRFDSVGVETYEALYKEHEAQADPATLTYKVTFSLPIPKGVNVLPGMSATIIADLSEILTGEQDGKLVPIEAVFSAEEDPLDAQDKYVWLVDLESMRARRHAVRAGQLTGANIVLTEGLDEGDVIIAAGVNAVQEGMLVRAMEREGGL